MQAIAGAHTHYRLTWGGDIYFLLYLFLCHFLIVMTGLLCSGPPFNTYYAKKKRKQQKRDEGNRTRPNFQLNHWIKKLINAHIKRYKKNKKKHFHVLGEKIWDMAVKSAGAWLTSPLNIWTLCLSMTVKGRWLRHHCRTSFNMLCFTPSPRERQKCKVMVSVMFVCVFHHPWTVPFMYTGKALWLHS